MVWAWGFGTSGLGLGVVSGSDQIGGRTFFLLLARSGGGMSDLLPKSIGPLRGSGERTCVVSLCRCEEQNIYIYIPTYLPTYIHTYIYVYVYVYVYV